MAETTITECHLLPSALQEDLEEDSQESGWRSGRTWICVYNHTILYLVKRQ